MIPANVDGFLGIHLSWCPNVYVSLSSTQVKPIPPNEGGPTQENKVVGIKLLLEGKNCNYHLT